MKVATWCALIVGGVAVGALAVGGPDWHRPVPGEQIGYDGAGMVQFANTSPWQVAAAPTTIDTSVPSSAAAAASYANITELTGLSGSEFLRAHNAMTTWVAAKEDCSFCHQGTDYAADGNPMKAVSRQMIALTRHINTVWRSHVGSAGVTCFTCHRGEPVPPATWFPRAAHAPHTGFFQAEENWNENAGTVYGFFPDNGLALYLLEGEPSHVESKTAFASGQVAPELAVKRVYEFMMQMSDDIGVNCGYCHNSRDFQDWSQSSPNRWTGYEAIQMTRELDVAYLAKLDSVLSQTIEPDKQNMLVADRQARGPAAATGFVVCATCHYGRTKPDQGVATGLNYPQFDAPAPQP